MPAFTLVSTIYNEAKRLEQTISDIEAQTLQPTEIIITDAGSRDGSMEILKAWQKRSLIPILLLEEKGCNVARGRNLAIKAAHNELIVSTDFGCRFHPQWLASLIEPFEEDGDLEVVGGAFTIQSDNITTQAGKADYILQNGYPVIMDEHFSVSSRSIAYKKRVWEKVGGYPEWLTLAADDTIFWKLIKKEGFKYRFSSKAFVYWGRHQNHKAFGREAYRYGLGDGESKINYRNFLVHLAETTLRYIFIINLLLIPILLLTGVTQLLIFQLLLFILTIPGMRSYLNAYKRWNRLKTAEYNFTILLHALYQLELSRQQYIKGYIKGLMSKEKKEGREELTEKLKG